MYDDNDEIEYKIKHELELTSSEVEWIVQYGNAIDGHFYRDSSNIIKYDLILDIGDNCKYKILYSKDLETGICNYPVQVAIINNYLNDVSYKLRNELELTSAEVEWIVYNCHNMILQTDVLNGVREYTLTTSLDTYMYTIKYLHDIRTKISTYPPQIAMKEEINNG